MVVVKIELWPHGDETKKSLLGVAFIANDGTGDAVKSSYEINLSHSGKYVSRPGVWKSGKLTNHLRSLSPYHLVMRALQAVLGK